MMSGYFFSPAIKELKKHAIDTDESELAIAVIALAIMEAKGRGIRKFKNPGKSLTKSINMRESAYNWIKNKEPGFVYWCELLAIDESWASAIALKEIEEYLDEQSRKKSKAASRIQPVQRYNFSIVHSVHHCAEAA